MQQEALQHTVLAWFAQLDAVLREVPAGASGLFADDCFWRDFSAFTWNITTCEGHAAIAGMLDACATRTAAHGWEIMGEANRQGDVT